jgi:hypothetical protein
MAGCQTNSVRKLSRMTAVLSAGARGYAPDPVFEIASKCARPPRNDSEKAVDSFCSAGKVGVQRRSDSPARLCGPMQR